MPMVRLVFEYVPIIERSLSGKRRYFVNAMQAAVAAGAPGNLDRSVPFGEAPRLHRRCSITAAGAVAGGDGPRSVFPDGGNRRGCSLRDGASAPWPRFDRHREGARPLWVR